jgi:hypothetical protein
MLLELFTGGFMPYFKCLLVVMFSVGLYILPNFIIYKESEAHGCIMSVCQCVACSS